MLELGLASDLRSNAVLETTSVVELEDSLVLELGLASDMRLHEAWVTVMSVETWVLGLDSASDMV